MTEAAGAVLGYLRAQAEVIAARSTDVLADAPDAVHRSRVATRRSRSALRTFAPLFKHSRTGRLRSELAWHADHLGAPRDAEVLKQRLLAALGDLDPDQVVGPVRRRLGAALDATHAQAHASLVQSMRTSRYAELRTALTGFVSDPPLRRAGRAVSAAELSDLLGGAADRVRRLDERAVEISDDVHRWHEVRKAAKAARYCSEALVPLFDGPAQQLAAAWEAVTEALGELQDTVVAESCLATDAVRAREAGEPADTYLALIAQELRLREESLHAGQVALRVALELPLP
ncbi:CHAD domain-containing protein [Micropruina sp.]|uniref:CHAD domain-containing protein n=1 Tax=Micropruina sp. TaxID=2737536 RepID=UPI0039E24CA3